MAAGLSTEELKDIEARDAAGRLFTYMPFEQAVYLEDDADPIIRHIGIIRTADELRMLAEGWRRGMLMGEKIGRQLQMQDIRNALGIGTDKEQS